MATTLGKFESALGDIIASPPNPLDPPAVSVLVTTPGENMTTDSPISPLTTLASPPGDIPVEKGPGIVTMEPFSLEPDVTVPVSPTKKKQKKVQTYQLQALLSPKK